MRGEIKRLMEARARELNYKEKPQVMAAENSTINLTPQELQTLLQNAIAGALSTPRGMSPLEQKQFEKENEMETRRKRMYYFYSKAEAEADARRKMGCTHLRDPKTGNMVPPGTWGGEWRTGGQLHSGNNTASLICMFCGTAWSFRVTNQERDNLEQRGMLGLQPPDDAFCIVSCATCGDSITNKEMTEHKGPCRERYMIEMAAIDAKIQERSELPV